MLTRIEKEMVSCGAPGCTYQADRNFNIIA